MHQVAPKLGQMLVTVDGYTTQQINDVSDDPFAGRCGAGNHVPAYRKLNKDSFEMLTKDRCAASSVICCCDS